MRRARWALGTVLAVLATASMAQDRGAQTPPDPDAFRNPPAEMRPHVLYPWSIASTREGIDADLQAIRDSGLGGVLMADGSESAPKGSADGVTPPWFDLSAHMIARADQLGLKVGIAPGEPQVAPERAAQQLVWSEMRVTGDGQTPVAITLPQPHIDHGTYRDAAVIAFPASPGDESAYRDAIETMDTAASVVPAALTDRDLHSAVEIAPDTPLVVTMKAPFAAQAVTLQAARGAPGFSATIEASADGITWSRIGRVDVGARGAGSPGTLNFPSVEASLFRITPSAGVQLAEALFHATPRFDPWAAKAGKPPLDLMTRYAIDPARVIDLSAYLDAAGTLNWTPPEGEWAVLRFGHTPTQPLQFDRLGTAATDQQFDNGLARVVKATGSLAGKTFDMAAIGSAEAALESWTATLPADFQKRNGYAITAYLPALTGRIVGDLDTSNRFLFDFRRTLAGMIADNHVGRMQERASGAGLKLIVRDQDTGMPGALEMLGRAQLPMAGGREVSMAASASHIYGKPLVAGRAEAGPWEDHPDTAKTRGDAMFARGVNRIVLDRWLPQARPWMEYLTRSQYMLRQGTPVADILYFTGEDRPRGTMDPGLLLPPGYRYDFVNAEVLLTRARVKDGRIVLASGTSYRLLVIPRDIAGMTPPLAAKLRELVEAGMAVLGPRPAHPLTLAGKSEGDAVFRTAVDAMWGDGKAVRKVGAGRVFPAGSIGDALTALKVAPDAECRTATPGGTIDWLHRKAGASHIYFIANRQRRAERVSCTFRVGSAAPSLWDARSGDVTRAVLFSTERDRTAMTFDLPPAGSIFVTLDFAAGARRIDWIARDGVRFVDATAAPAPTPPAPLLAEITRDRLGEAQALVWESGAYTTSDGGKFKAEIPPAIAIEGPWNAAFRPGTATYARTIDLPEDMIRKGRRIFLDLGRVAIRAGLAVNGKDLGAIWSEPHRVDITDAVKPGPNAISLALAATPDAAPPASAPPGPVRLVFADQVKVE